MKKSLKKKILLSVAATALLLVGTMGGQAHAQDGSNHNANLLVDVIGGKLLIKANVGYAYNFANNWDQLTANKESFNRAAASSTLGYGATVGYTHWTGFGMAVDYLGFDHKWSAAAADGNQYESLDRYNVVTFVPSYDLRLGTLGIRAGLGLGFSVTSKKWNSAAVDTQEGAAAVVGALTGKATSNSDFILAPEVTIEYDNGLLHLDLNARYMHELKDVSYTASGDDGQSSGNQNVSYTAKSGPLAMFVGAGLGLNF
ncbi:MAG: hypothetical protein QM529_06590 [Hydrotalea sp.]|nr:hypothetical protein [Hydrotalea sp.]